MSVTKITDKDVNPSNVDGVPSTPSMRTLGSGAGQAAPGNQSHPVMLPEDGEPGEPGPPGQPGRDGAAGSAGSPGVGMPGEDGPAGEEGPPGRDGAAGAAGSPGVGLPGEDGADGERGPPGRDGALGPQGQAAFMLQDDSYQEPIMFPPGSPGGNVIAAFVLSGKLSPASFSTDQNDYNPTGLSGASTLSLVATSACQLTGLQGGYDGRVMVVQNVSAQQISIPSNSSSSSAANRFRLNNSPLLLNQDACAIFRYDGTFSFWRLIAICEFPSLSGIYANLDGNGLVPSNQMPYEHGIGTHHGSAVTIPSALMTLGYSCNVILTRMNNAGGTPGDLYSDRSEDTGTDFVVRSNGTFDICDFTYLVLII